MQVAMYILRTGPAVHFDRKTHYRQRDNLETRRVPSERKKAPSNDAVSTGWLLLLMDQGMMKSLVWTWYPEIDPSGR
jgi:hypothetical protein